MKLLAITVIFLLFPAITGISRPDWLKSSDEKRKAEHEQFDRWFTERWESAQGEKEFQERLDAVRPKPKAVPVDIITNEKGDIGETVFASGGWGATAACLIGELIRRLRKRIAEGEA